MNWLHAFAGLSLLFASALQFPCSSASLDTGKAEGETLAGALRSQKPVENAEFTGILKKRDAQGRRIETVLRFRAVLHETSWDAVYEAHPSGQGRAEKLVVVHTNAAPNSYL